MTCASWECVQTSLKRWAWQVPGNSGATFENKLVAVADA